MIRVKFEATKKVETSTATGNEFKVEMTTVTDGSDENKEFFKYTPSGKIALGILGPESDNLFVVGEYYFIDITPCDPSPVTPEK